MNRVIIVLVITCCLRPVISKAQVIPPGLGKAHAATWFAGAVQQDLRTIKHKGWKSVSYFGVGRKSNPDNFNPIQKPGIFILSRDFAVA